MKEKKSLQDMSLEELWQLFPIMLKPHNPAYESWYRQERDRLLRLFTGHGVRRISHIGSTCVPGLLAKPIVDILLELPGGYDRNAAARLLEGTGWLLMARDENEQTQDWNKGYTPEGFAGRVFHLHVKPVGDWDELYFRDYLREHPAAARQYESLKRSLLERHRHNRDAYTNAKSDFVALHTRMAREAFGGRYAPAP